MRIHNITFETIDTLILRLACVFTSVVLLLLFLPLLIGFDTCFAQESQSRMFSSPGEAGDALIRAAQKENEPAWKLSSEQGRSDVPFQWIVVRSTSEPIVVNLPDDFWNDINLSPTHLALTTNTKWV